MTGLIESLYNLPACNGIIKEEPSLRALRGEGPATGTSGDSFREDGCKMAEVEMKKVRMTQAEKDRKEERLHFLKGVRRQEVAQKLQEAREQGDLSENAEYDAAKDEQRDIEAEIMKLEELFKNVEIITDEDISSDSVGIGTSVRVLNLNTNKEKVYSVVGSTEASSLKGKISNESPIGRELENCVVGDEVTVRTPMGETAYRVLEIWKTTVGA